MNDEAPSQRSARWWVSAAWCAALAGFVAVPGEALASPPPSSSIPPTSAPDEEPQPGSLPEPAPDAEPEVVQTPLPFSSDSFASGPLVSIPQGCTVPAAPLAVFEGVARAATAEAVQFEIRQVRAGSLAGFAGAAPGSRVNVFYGADARFLKLDERYLVAVVVQAEAGNLESRVREPAPMFGGDAVIGVNESDIDCPDVDDQVVTLNTDGTAVDSGIFSGMLAARRSLVDAILQPALIAFAVLLGLVLFKHSLFGFARSLRDMSSNPRPIERRRTHRPVDGGQRSTDRRATNRGTTERGSVDDDQLVDAGQRE